MKKELRRLYFRIRDELAADLGWTKLDLHLYWKAKYFPLMADDEDCWDLDNIEAEEIVLHSVPSVTWLSEKGWRIYIEQIQNSLI